MDPHDVLEDHDALVVVDLQLDFFPGGSLAVDGADALVPPINAWIDAASERGLPVYAVRVWHPSDHPAFRSRGGPWPVHCVQDTPGAELHPRVHLPRDVVKIAIGTSLDRDQYSALDGTGLAEHLVAHAIARVWIAGIGLEHCIHETAIELARAGYEVHVIGDATAAIDEACTARAIADLSAEGVTVHAERTVRAAAGHAAADPEPAPDDEVDEASRESFPASDPPAFTLGRAHLGAGGARRAHT